MRKRVFELHAQGYSLRQIATRTNVPKSTIARWLREGFSELENDKKEYDENEELEGGENDGKESWIFWGIGIIILCFLLWIFLRE